MVSFGRVASEAKTPINLPMSESDRQARNDMSTTTGKNVSNSHSTSLCSLLARSLPTRISFYSSYEVQH